MQFTYSKRKPRSSPVVKKGSYCIDHVATGKRLLGYSSNLDKEIDRQLMMLSNGKHPSKKMQQQFDADDELLIFIYPATSMSTAKSDHSNQKKAIPDYYSYLLLN